MVQKARKYAPVQFYFAILMCEVAGRLSEGIVRPPRSYVTGAERGTSKAYMRGTPRRCMAATLFVCSAIAATQDGSPDPAFASVPFAQRMNKGDKDHIRWTAHVLPVELSNHQRLLAKVEAVIDGNELERRRGKGRFAILIQFCDSEHRIYQTHKSFDLDQVQEGTGKLN